MNAKFLFISVTIALSTTALLTIGCASEKPKDTTAEVKSFKGSAPPPDVQKMIAEKMSQNGKAVPVGTASAAPAGASKPQ